MSALSAEPTHFRPPEGKIYYWAQPVHKNTLKRNRVHDIPKVCHTVHMVRDGAAMTCILGALRDHEYGGIIFNPDPAIYRRPAVEPPELLDSDTLASLTRPALNEDIDDPRPLGRSGSKLECDIFKALRSTFFTHVNREAVILSHRVILPKGLETYRAAKFVLRGGAYVTELRDCGAMEDFRKKNVAWSNRSTIAYACYLPRVSDDVPAAFLGAFGLSGTSTLLWAHLLSTRYRDLLRDLVRSPVPRIVLAKISEPSGERAPAMLSDLSLTSSIVADCVVDGWPTRGARDYPLDACA